MLLLIIIFDLRCIYREREYYCCRWTLILRDRSLISRNILQNDKEGRSRLSCFLSQIGKSPNYYKYFSSSFLPLILLSPSASTSLPLPPSLLLPRYHRYHPSDLFASLLLQEIRKIATTKYDFHRRVSIVLSLYFLVSMYISWHALVDALLLRLWSALILVSSLHGWSESSS